MKDRLTLTRISLITAAVLAAVNVVAVFGLSLTIDQLGAINVLVTAIGAAVHGWFNPEFGLLGVGSKPEDPPITPGL